VHERTTRRGELRAYYGVREFRDERDQQRPGAAWRLHPYDATFLVFSDYSRNAPCCDVGADPGERDPRVHHDSIGLGEDGPTHQPVEHLAVAALIIPNNDVWRPCERSSRRCHGAARRAPRRPSCFVFSRQNPGAPGAATRRRSRPIRVALLRYVLHEPDWRRGRAILLWHRLGTIVALADGSGACPGGGTA
jgi:transketolase